ncbi:hypothetical protein KKI23_03295 [Patescibacteria group bacterium]|nr:hypothetical protein [Patescibacteria group bacterium]
MDSQNSILDKVIDSHKTQEKEQFYPSELVAVLLKCLASKEEDILRRRFGLNRDQKETLEQIGNGYNVTRERVRQIENNSVTKIRALKNFNQLVDPVKHLITSLLTEQGGFLLEADLLMALVAYSDEREMDNRSVLFLLTVILKGQFQFLDNTKFRACWGLKHSSVDLLEQVVGEQAKIVEDSGKPMTAKQIVDQFNKSELASQNSAFLDSKAITSYLNISKQIDRNPYDEYGLSTWGNINPKRINDKIFLVMKRKGKPMHFTEIAKEINRVKFDKRKAYPPTIHNELIMNEQYVLVGRGIYALKEWGYKPGIVSDVLQNILKKSDHPLAREELVKAVMEQRIVKKNTIHLALTDKKKFTKTANGKYQLAS